MTVAPPPVARPLYEDPAIHHRRWFLLGTMCLSLVLVVMSVSGLVTAIPTMQEELHASASEIQWILDAYAIVFAGFLLTAGALGDRFGRKRALLSGLGVFGAGAILGGLATTSTQVIAGRAVMGLGAALVMPATLSIITTIFPPEERVRAITIWAGFAGAGGAIGPIISGALLEGYWWGSALLVNLPVVALTFLAILRYAPESRDEHETPLDPVGAVLSILGLGALVYAIIQGGEHDFTDAPVIIAAVVAVALLIAFVRWERRTEHPMLPLRFFDDRRFSIGSGVITVAFFVMFGFFFLVTQYLQFARGYSPLEAGVALLPFPIVFILLSPTSAALMARFGAAKVMASGLTVIAIGFIILSFLTPGTPYLVVALTFAILGGGMSITAAPATTEIMSTVPPEKAGVGSAVNDTTRELGGALGIAIFGSIANRAYRSGIDLSGIGLGAQPRHQGEDSIGAAAQIAQTVRGGALVTERAAAAYTDAFNLANTVSVAVALIAAVAVLALSRRRRTATADESTEHIVDVDLVLVPATHDQGTE